MPDSAGGLGAAGPGVHQTTLASSSLARISPNSRLSRYIARIESGAGAGPSRGERDPAILRQHLNVQRVGGWRPWLK